MQLEFELGDDPEVTAAAAQAPEQVGVLVRAGVQQPAVGGDEIGADEVVAGEAVLAHQPADPTAERVPGDTRRRYEASGGGEAVRLRLVVDVGPDRAAADVRAPQADVSMRTWFIGPRSITIPPLTVEKPATL